MESGVGLFLCLAGCIIFNTPQDKFIKLITKSIGLFMALEGIALYICSQPK